MGRQSKNRERVRAERAGVPPSDEVLHTALVAAGRGPKPGEVWRSKLGPGEKPKPVHVDRLTVVGCGVDLTTGTAHAVVDPTGIPDDVLPAGHQRPLMIIPLGRFLTKYEKA